MKIIKIPGKAIDRCEVATYVPESGKPSVKLAKMPDEYAFMKIHIAEGPVGRLYAGRLLLTGEQYAIKEIRLRRPDAATPPRWRDISDSLVSSIENTWQQERMFGPAILFANDKMSRLYMVQRPAFGRIDVAINQLSESVARCAVVRTLALAIAEDLREIHKVNALHFDIIPSNIVYRKNTFEVELLDFGMNSGCEFVDAKGTRDPDAHWYVPTEPTEDISAKHAADVFSLGVTLGELAVQDCLFGRRYGLSGETETFCFQDLRNIAAGCCTDSRLINWFEEYMGDLKAFDAPLAGLIKDMLNVDAGKRPGLDSVIERLKGMPAADEQHQAMHRAWQELPASDDLFDHSLATLDSLGS